MERRWILDLGIAAALAGAMVAEMAYRTDHRTETTSLGIAVCIVAVLPTLARHRHPGPAMFACMALLFGVLAVVDVHNTAPFSSMLCGYSLALVADRRRLALAASVMVPGRARRRPALQRPPHPPRRRDSRRTSPSWPRRC